RVEIGAESVKAHAVRRDEIAVFIALLQHGLGQALEQRNVRADARLEIVRRDLAAALDHGGWRLGNRELDEARLLGRVDDNHLPPTLAAVLEHVDEARM